MLRLLKQLSEVYSSMHISEVGKLVPFMSFSDVEAVVVDAVKYDYLQVRMFVLPIYPYQPSQISFNLRKLARPACVHGRV